MTAVIAIVLGGLLDAFGLLAMRDTSARHIGIVASAAGTALMVVGLIWLING
jgi:hypothetical protein